MEPSVVSTSHSGAVYRISHGMFEPTHPRTSRSYIPFRKLGTGSYGTVYSASVTDGHGCQDFVALKVIRPFSDTLKCVRTLREIRILRHFDHENITRLLDVTTFTSVRPFSDIVLVQELMTWSLEKVMHQAILEEPHVRVIMHQVLSALEAVHSASILHRDLKPANILVDSSAKVKICDFGLARTVPSAGRDVEDMTEYVVTRWYRAPEVVFRKRYGPPLDLWSAGCIFAEMLLGEVLFAAESDFGLTHCFIAQLGFRTIDDVYPEELSECCQREQEGELALDEFDEQTASLLHQMLKVDPNQRISASASLEHPYFPPHHVSCSKPQTAKGPSDGFKVDYARDLPPMDDMRGLLAKELSGRAECGGVWAHLLGI